MENRTINRVFEAVAQAFPARIAIADDGERLTYTELNRRANRLADFLAQCHFSAESVIGVLVDNSNETIVSILGVLKAGCAFLPIDTQFPLERIKLLLSEARSPALISTSRYIEALNRCQWECGCLDYVIALDSVDFYGEEEAASSKMNVELWDYVGDTATDYITRGGWVSGYDGRPFSKEEMDEYADNAFLKLKPYLHKTARVLEIGCSSGITLFKLAPYVGTYVATDISISILEHTRHEAEQRGLENIRFAVLGAHELDQLTETDFDIIIFNSVIQNFSGFNYLRKALKAAVRLAKPESVLFAGDILDPELKPELLKSFSDYNLRMPPAQQKAKTDWSNELFVPRGFFMDLHAEWPYAGSPCFSSKIGAISNELTRFRYDMVLQIDKGAVAVKTNVKRKHQVDGTVLGRYAENDPVDGGENAGALACLMYTSGSTGNPKGVMVTHGSILYYVDWFVREFRIDEYDSSLLLSRINFDGVYTSIWGTLLRGGFLRIVPYGKVLEPEAILDFVLTDKITFIKLTPSLLNILINDKDASKMLGADTLRLMVIGGEPIQTGDVRKLYGARKDIILVNHYGPTEATIGVVFCRIDRDRLDDFVRRPVIGSPIPGTRVYILNEQLEILPENIPGEIFIGGSSLARGYLNSPQTTKEKFINNPYTAGGERLYRTGDIGRWLPGGVIELMGRTDAQIKIRGYRVEPGEIESMLLGYPGVSQVKVLKRGDGEGNDLLVAYYTAGGDPDVAGWRASLERRLPDYMIPAFFVRLEAFPMNSSGKLDMKQLPDPLRSLRNGHAAQPETGLEASIMALWREILGRDDFGILDDFFDIGGHSLKAVKLCSLIYKQLSIEVRLRDVFEHPTVARFARFLETSKKTPYTEIQPVDQAEYYAVSHGQMRLWFSSQRERTSLAYLQNAVKLIRGNLDRTLLESAFRRLIDRHEILRTTFHFIDGRLWQKVRTTADIFTPFEVIDLRTHDNAGSMEAEIIDSQLRTDVDLEDGPLFRVSLLRKAEEDWLFVLTIHHIITDGLSNEIIFRELSFYYNDMLRGQRRELSPLRIQYKDFAVWQNRIISEGAAHRAFWKKQLEDGPGFIHFPADLTPAFKGEEGLVYAITFDSELYAKMRGLTRDQDNTLFVFFLSIVFGLLHRYSSEKDMIVGISVEGRDDIELQNQVGFYVNTLPLRLQLGGDETFSELAVKVKQLVFDVFAHRVYPFDRIVEENAGAGTSKEMEMIGVMVNWQIKRATAGDIAGGLDGVKIHDHMPEDTLVKFDITLNFQEFDDRVQLYMEYRKDLYSREQAGRICRHLKHLITGVTADPTLRAAVAGLTTPEEQAQLVGMADAPELFSGGDRTLLDLFADQVAASPDRIAVEWAGGSLCFRELDVRSNRLAHYLMHDQGIRPDDLVGILQEHSEWMIVSLLAVLKCGAGYVPLDVSFPRERIGLIIGDSGLRCILADRDADRSRQTVDCVNLHAVSDAIDRQPETSPGISVRSNQRAYVIYTSGSTGRPKGCIISHKNLLNYVAWAAGNYPAGKNGHSWAVFSPLSFDLTVTSIFCPLVRGERMYLFAEAREIGHVLADSFGAGSPVTAIKLTPTHIDILGRLHIESTNIGLVVCGGEALLKRHIDIIRKISPDIVLFNEYGPTECTVGCTCKLIAVDDKEVLIGRPVANTRVYILSETLRLQPMGIEGEICVAGDGVAAGYLNNTSLTREKFVDDPFVPGDRMYRTGDRGRWKGDGQIEYLGRKDHQVKIRGYRVELQELESVAGAIEGVDAAVAVLIEKEEDKRIALYYLSQTNKGEGSVREELGTRLPGYMLPQFIIMMPDFPVSVNGKIDVKRLPDPLTFAASHAGSGEACESLTESRLLAVWRTVLGIEKIGVTDNFFTLGGHSLNALRILLEIQDKFGVELTLRDFFEKNNIRELARFIAGKEPAIAADTPVNAASGEDKIPLSHLQKSLWILSQDEGASAAYTICSGMCIKGELDPGELESALLLLIGRHEILRTQFLLEGEDLVQKIYTTEEMDFKMSYRDLSLLADTSTAIGELVATERATPFRFEPYRALLRVLLIKTGPGEHVLLYTIHHIICDAESLRIVFRELMELYVWLKEGKAAGLCPVYRQFRDYAVWESALLSSDAFTPYREFWHRQYANVPASLRLNTDHPIPGRQTFNGDVLHMEIPMETTKAIRKVSAEQQASLFMFFIAAVHVLLHKYTGQDDIVVGIPVSTRLRKELEDQVGPYVNTLPVRAGVRQDDTFVALLREVRQTLIHSLGFQNYPFDMLVSDLNILASPGRNPLFDVMVSYQSVETRLSPVITTAFDVEEFEPASASSQFMLSIDLYESAGTIRAVFNFNTDVFRKISIELMQCRFAALLSQIVASPYEKIAFLNPDRELEKITRINEMEFDY